MKTAVVYPYFAYYRQPIIKKLLSVDFIKYYFLGGITVGGQFKNLKTIDFKKDERFIELKNIWFFKYFLFQPTLTQNLKNGKYDLVIIFADWKYISTWSAVFYCKRKGIPVLFWSHGYRIKKRSINDYIKFVYFNLFNGGFVYDNRAKRVFLERNYKKPIDVVFNSLDYEVQSKIYEETKIYDNHSQLFKRYEPYVVFSGRLTNTKKLELLFDSIANLILKSIKINVILIGDGAHKHILEVYANKLGVSNNIIFWGECYDEDIIASCFNNAIACVIPSAVGLSAIHSLTYGCPVITDDGNVTHGPEIESVIKDVSGRFYIKGDPQSLANEIEYFMSLSNEQRNNLKSNCINIIREKFNCDYQAKIFNNRILTEIEKRKNKI